MTDRPIIFSAPMVRALLERRKTQTRRLAWRYREVPTPDDGEGLLRLPSPWQRVQPGDRLWVREGWAEVGTYDPGLLIYRADYPACVPAGIDNIPDASAVKWRAPIHQMRRASRLTLTVTDVRVQRVHDMLLNDYEAEGVVDRPMSTDEGIRAFSTLWDSLHGPGAWDANPHVVALTFAVDQRNIDRAA
jgi:hypothetical protein